MRKNILKIFSWVFILILLAILLARSFSYEEIWLSRTGFALSLLILLLILFDLLKIVFVKNGQRFFYFFLSLLKSINRALIENPDLQKFFKNHQNLISFVKKRLNKNHFSGLPLTLLSLSLIYILFLVAGTVEDIINSDILVMIDIRVANLLAIFRSARLTEFFYWITLLGKWPVILVFTVCIILVLWLKNKRAYIFPLLLGMVGSEFFTFIGKFVFHRARPNVALYVESSFSFPSGHATIAVAFYGFITYLLIKDFKQWRSKINILFAGLVVIFLIGFSRLYLGVHYVSDVWSGYLIGAIWLIIAISLVEYFSYQKQFVETIYVGRKKQLSIIFLIIISIGFYLAFAVNYNPPSPIVTQNKKATIINNATSIFNKDNLKYTEMLTGDKQEPLSFIIMAKNDQQLIDLFEKSDWRLADDVTLSTVAKMIKAAWQQSPYSRAPMTPDFWNANVHDFGFEKSTDSNNVRERHHARFWKTNYLTKDVQMIFVGTASFDGSIKWGLTHKINPDIDTERTFLFNDLQSSAEINSFQYEQFVKPTLGINFAGDQFFTDGKIYIIKLK